VIELLLAQLGPQGPKPLPVNPEIIVRAAEAASAAADRATLAAILAGLAVVMLAIIGAVVTYMAAKFNLVIYQQARIAKVTAKIDEKEHLTE